MKEGKRKNTEVVDLLDDSEDDIQIISERTLPIDLVSDSDDDVQVISPSARAPARSLSLPARPSPPRPGRNITTQHPQGLCGQSSQPSPDVGNKIQNQARSDRAQNPSPELRKSNQFESPTKRARTENAARQPSSKSFQKSAVIDLDDEDDDQIGTSTAPIIIDEAGLEEAEDEMEKEMEEEMEEMEREEAPQPHSGNRSGANHRRNAPIVAPFKSIDSHHCRNSKVCLRPGNFVQLSDGYFLQIKTIVRDTRSQEVTLRGYIASRPHKSDDAKHLLAGKLRRVPNELCWMHEVDQDDPRPMLEQSVAEVSVDQVVKPRKLYRANVPLTEDCDIRLEHAKELGMHFDSQKEQKTWVESNDVLVVRWCYIRTFKDAEMRKKDNSKGKTYASCSSYTLRTLHKEECDIGLRFYVPPIAMRLNWRPSDDTNDVGDFEEIDKEKFRRNFGSALGGFSSSSRPNQKSSAGSSRKYTLADTFCGAGGASSGAVLAELVPIVAFDNNKDVEPTYRANFPDSEFLCCSHVDFLDRKITPSTYIVDVLHLSMPCQFWSPNKTQASRDPAYDQANHDTIYGVDPLLQRTRPRMVTSEQTFGFIAERFREPFSVVIRQFTDNGFSIRWGVIELLRFGLPQNRKRLLTIAAGPGETLPEFPAYTHTASGTGPFERFVTPNKILSDIPRDAHNHDLKDKKLYEKKDHPQWDGDKPVATISTNGATIKIQGLTRRKKIDKLIGLPDASRSLTIRELASLQGFPRQHRFVDGRNRVGVQKAMIGNAYPPSVARHFFRAVRLQLENTDKEERDADAAAARA